MSKTANKIYLLYCGRVIGGEKRPLRYYYIYIPTDENRTELLYIIMDNLPQNFAGIKVELFFRVTIYTQTGKSLHVETHKWTPLFRWHVLIDLYNKEQNLWVRFAVGESRIIWPTPFHSFWKTKYNTFQSVNKQNV